MSLPLNTCAALITKHFQLPDEELEHCQSSEKELEQALSAIINNLLNQDLARLMNAFYKIDLNEIVFKRIITSEAPDQIGLALAKEVIKREWQKVKTRERHRSN
ncbi:hypothetical protein N7E81_02805 [Reichenbachiella carrageenanivorans]|uniref:Uncharacterized protein n=1 Tax=Reichenbachiella carrageenanivorans TaxID=2979869 RepID=A0ABY6D293_9BACT|nr:hypothetical protein [Reichenbachiella carrageenanivorans]UXX80034.1 hypothetical protein N7E81_02805 [Reichenbachiella carrageenanivorans]